MKVEAKRLKINRETVLNVIDLRGNEDTINSIDNKIIFPGYHMNKKHWFTLIINGTIKLANKATKAITKIVVVVFLYLIIFSLLHIKIMKYIKPSAAIIPHIT